MIILKRYIKKVKPLAERRIRYGAINRRPIHNKSTRVNLPLWYRVMNLTIKDKSSILKLFSFEEILDECNNCDTRVLNIKEVVAFANVERAYNGFIKDKKPERFGSFFI